MFNMKIKVIILFVLVNINVYSQEDTLQNIIYVSMGILIIILQLMLLHM